MKHTFIIEMNTANRITEKQWLGIWHRHYATEYFDSGLQNVYGTVWSGIADKSIIIMTIITLYFHGAIQSAVNLAVIERTPVKSRESLYDNHFMRTDMLYMNIFISYE